MASAKYDLTGTIARASKRRNKGREVGRSIVYTICDGRYFEEGRELGYQDVLLGDWDCGRATRWLRREVNDTLQIIKTETFKQYVSMELLDFWLYARATSDPQKVRETHV